MNNILSQNLRMALKSLLQIASKPNFNDSMPATPSAWNVKPNNQTQPTILKYVDIID